MKSSQVAAAAAARRLAQPASPIPAGFYSPAWESDRAVLESLLDLSARRNALLAKLRRLGLARLRAGEIPSLTKRVKETVSPFTLSSRPAAGGGEHENPVTRLCAEIGKAGGHLAAACRYVARSLGVDLPEEISETVLGSIARMINELRGPYAAELRIDADWPLFAEKARPAAGVAKEYAFLTRQLARYNPKLITEEEADQLSEQYRKTEHALMLVYPFMKRRLMRRVRHLQNDWRDPASHYDNFPDLFNSMAAYASAAAKIGDAGPLIRKHAPKAWRGGEIDSELLEE